mgnify:CR=1 FL=1
MDISKPASSSAQLSPSSQVSTIKSDIESIGLKANQTYTATVSQLLSNDQSLPNSPTKNLFEWLVKINGHDVKVSTREKLNLGQQLGVKLVMSSSTAQPTLFIQSQPTTPHLTNTASSNVDLQQMLQAMGKIISQQTPLSFSTRVLSTFYPKLFNLTQPAQTTILSPPKKMEKVEPAPSLNSQTLTKEHSNSIKSLLLNALPKVEEILLSTKNSTAHTYMKHILQNSGLFMESSLKQGSSSVSLKPLMSYLEQLSLNRVPTNGEQGNKSSENSSLQTPTSSKHTQTLHTDIKATIISLISALKNETTLGMGTTNTPLAEQSLSGVEHVRQPFNFPNLPTPSNRVDNPFRGNELDTGQTLKLLSSMLSRIQFNQLNSLFQSQNASNDQQTIQSWFFELPLVTDDGSITPFSLRIDKEEQENEKNKEETKKDLQWTLGLSFDLEHLGPIFIQVSLIPPSISSTIWAEKSDTFTLASKEMKRLTTKLEELGLEVGKISCKHGQPKQQKTTLEKNMVDIQV